MRIIQFTPGTGSYYCGSCLRDRALTVALRRLGHDVTMAPLYLPLVLEEDITGERPLFGGINLYLQRKSALFRHAPRWLDRLLDHPRLLRWAARRASMTAPRDLGAVTLSILGGDDGRQRKELDKLTDWLSTRSRPDVVCLSNALLVGLARRIKQTVGCPVACTLQGEDSFLDSLEQPYRDQSWRMLAVRGGDVDVFIAVSRYYAQVMIDRLNLPENRVRVVHNGIDLDGFAPSPAAAHPPVLGYLARLCADKGLHLLVDAFVDLKSRTGCADMKLHVAGVMTGADHDFVAGQRRKLQAAGVMADVTISPNLDRRDKIDMLRGLSVFSVPATYGESFGLYVLEALACGVPAIQPRCAAFGELLQVTGGGILYQPDDPHALADAIEQLLSDEQRRRTLAEQGRKSVVEHFSADRMARQIAETYDGLRI